MRRFSRHVAQQGLRLVLLVAVIAAAGVGLGFAAGYPVSLIQFEESDSVRLDQARLAGEIDPEVAVLVAQDLPIGWEPGDEVLAGFTLLGAGFCGESVPLPTTLSAIALSVYQNDNDDSFLLSQAVRVDRWQSATGYIEDVEEAVSSCEQFFRTDLDGSRVPVGIREAADDPPITDHVSRTFVAEDGSSVQTWSMMAVGDVIVSLLHAGPARPQEGLLRDLEDRILIRVDPRDFAPGGVPTTIDDLIDPMAPDPLDGAADETEAPEPGAPEEGPAPDAPPPEDGPPEEPLD